MIIDIAGVVVGEVRCVHPHPKGTSIWLADVDLGNTAPVRIVFGGAHKLAGGELVPVAPTGAIVTEFRPRTMKQRLKKLRSRRYREEWSHGMLCSLGELGWIYYGPNEVARLRDVTPGQCLDDLPVDRRPSVVVNWDRAKTMEQEKMARVGVAVLDLPTLPAAAAAWRDPW